MVPPNHWYPVVPPNHCTPRIICLPSTKKSSDNYFTRLTKFCYSLIPTVISNFFIRIFIWIFGPRTLKEPEKKVFERVIPVNNEKELMAAIINLHGENVMIVGPEEFFGGRKEPVKRMKRRKRKVR
uniref:Uncharacterized protein n=1 Tax=Caenorhabditis tropicalis TaxID=1561998 RepID=A0A1I7UZP9_9PELO